MIDHVGIYGSRVAEGLSAFNVGLVKTWSHMLQTGRNQESQQLWKQGVPIFFGKYPFLLKKKHLMSFQWAGWMTFKSTAMSFTAANPQNQNMEPM